MSWVIHGPKTGKAGFTHDSATVVSVVKKKASGCIYKHKEQKGKAECYPYNDKKGWEFYPLSKHNWNDKITSLMVPKGVTMKLCEHGDMKGGCHKYVGPNKFHAIKNDWYSSMRVCKTGNRMCN